MCLKSLVGFFINIYMKNDSLHLDSINKLLLWYNKQSLGVMPWRNTRDPYKIWLSEIMLQQTQIKTVIPYYNRWLARLPSLGVVAKAHQKTILKLWEGLGYYQRAINFHHSCKFVYKNCNGAVPNTPNDFIKLRGVGDYICAAVQSIAFNYKMACLDGNVRRVMSRVLCLDIKKIKNTKRISTLLNKWIQSFDAADFNQAIMDLGRTVCTPRQPLCTSCPLKLICKAYIEDKITLYPIKNVKKNIPIVNVSIGIIWKNDKFLICKRKNTNFLNGLWELPGGKIEPPETPEACLKREINEEVNLKIKILGGRAALINHKYSHFHAKINVFNCVIISSENFILKNNMKWIFPIQIKDFPFPRANHKFFNQMMPK